MEQSFTSWENELYHHGVKGQKWGIRRYQKENGELTSEGVARYTKSAHSANRAIKKLDKAAYKLIRKSAEVNKEDSEKADQLAKKADRIRNQTKKISDEMKKKGYAIGLKDRSELVGAVDKKAIRKYALTVGALAASVVGIGYAHAGESGKKTVKAAFAAGLGAAALTAIGNRDVGRTPVVSEYYHVSKKK